MKKTRKLRKIISIFLIVAFCLPFAAACGDKGGDTGTTTVDNATEAGTEEQVTTEAPPPTEPPTEKPTNPPTEPPTDPASLPAPDVIAEGWEIIPGARYYLWSPNSNLYLNVDGDYNYAGFTQEAYTGKPDQMFVFEKVREEVSGDKVTPIYKIRALGTTASYLDTESGDGETDGQDLLATVQPEGEGSHEWTLKKQTKPKDVDQATFSIMTVISGNKKCIDVDGVSVDEGHLIHLWAGGTAANQKWVFELVADVESGKLIPHGLQIEEATEDTAG